MILGGRRCCTLSVHWPGRSASAARFSGRLSHFVSKRPIWLAEAAEPVIRPVANLPAHRRIAAQPLGVVHVLVAGQPTEHRLTQQAGQPMATILAGARVRQRIGTRASQAQRVSRALLSAHPSGPPSQLPLALNKVLDLIRKLSLARG
jgi:hypothetical protein